LSITRVVVIIAHVQIYIVLGSKTSFRKLSHGIAIIMLYYKVVYRAYFTQSWQKTSRK